MTLNIDHRPTEFDGLWGNAATLSSLKSVFVEREHDYPKAVLLHGPKGCGKTTIARIIADILLGKPYQKAGQNFSQIDGGDVKADTVRQIKQMVRFKPIKAKRRIWLIDEAHMIGQGGDTEKNIPQNNMLTLLEEPPKHVCFILCTTDPARLVATIRSRCHEFEVSYLNRKDMSGLLKEVLGKENVDWVSDEVLGEVFEASDGCPRDALKILDQVVDLDPEKMIDSVQAFGTQEKNIIDLGKAVLSGQSWDRVRKIIKEMDLSNPEQARRAMLSWMMKETMAGRNVELCAGIYDCFKDPTYSTGKPGFVFACHQAVVFVDDMKF